MADGKFNHLGGEPPAAVDPICDTVKKLQPQRMFMVGEPEQYAFIYKVRTHTISI